MPLPWAFEIAALLSLAVLTAAAAALIRRGSLRPQDQTHPFPHSHQELLEAFDLTLESWARTLERTDSPGSNGGSAEAETTLRLARRLAVPEEQLVHIRRGALLHDIGRMGVPAAIFNKPGPLSTEEWQEVRKHPTIAREMLAGVATLADALEIPYCHHERWDGSGYPRGLKGEEIPLAARIFAVVDVWQALSKARPFRPAWPDEQVRAHLRANAGAQFDPQVVTAFLEMLN